MHRFRRLSVVIVAICVLTASSGAADRDGTTATAARPNVVLIIADDQGHGDLGVHGNPIIRTPHLDRLAHASTQFVNFYVSPVCSPTRASLMTGRYNYRTGVVDTYLGRSMMHAEETTLAEMLGAAGYRTGIFGKWHLGDNYPLRAMDQGFQESLVLKGGGIGQPSDPPGGSSYTDPLLLHNGKLERFTGYCSDVYTDEAMRFIERSRDRPFFVYLAYNAPHAPLEVPERYERMYASLDLTPAGLPKIGRPVEGRIDPLTTARVYGMVTNIDENVGRLMARLDELKLAENTIVIFLTDNGPQQPRYNSGMRGRKGSVYDGGIRVPCFVRWPARVQAGRKIDRIAAHIDVLPTLLDACGLQVPADSKPDGRSLLPLLTGSDNPNWPDRTLYFQWHRGDEPQLGRAFAARSQRWKLVQAQGAAAQGAVAQGRLELYDMAADPYEQQDVAADNPQMVDQLRAGYEAWFADVRSTRNFAPPRIHIGTPHETPTVLTPQDWRGPQAGWGPKDRGHWEVEFEPGVYDIRLHFASGHAKAGWGAADAQAESEVANDATTVTFHRQAIRRGPARLEAWVGDTRERRGVKFLEVIRVE